MRIVVAHTFVAFGSAGGAEAARELAAHLAAPGVQVELGGVPVDPAAPASEQRVGLRLLDLRADADRLFCVGADAALLRHPDKRVWLGAGLDALPRAPAARYARALAEAVRIAVARGDAAEVLLRTAACPARVLEPAAGSARVAAALAA